MAPGPHEVTAPRHAGNGRSRRGGPKGQRRGLEPAAVWARLTSVHLWAQRAPECEAFPFGSRMCRTFPTRILCVFREQAWPQGPVPLRPLGFPVGSLPPFLHTPPTSLTRFRFLPLVPLPLGCFPSLVSQPARHRVPWILQPHLLTQIWLLLCPHCLFLDSGQHPLQAGRPHQRAVQRSSTHFPHCRGVFLKILVFPG